MFDLAVEMGHPNPPQMFREMPGWLVGAWRAYYKVRSWEQQEASGQGSGGTTVKHRARRGA